jgi:hypothetical protein
MIEDTVPASGMMSAGMAVAAPEARRVLQRIPNEAAISVTMGGLIVPFGTFAMVMGPHM